MAGGNANVIYRVATPADIESMTTMVPRSYDPDAFLPQVIPDTPLIREWWAKTYGAALEDPAARILIAVEGTKTVGIFTMHYLGPDPPAAQSGGVTVAIPLTPDHSPMLKEAFDGLKEERKELMGDEPHYLIELVGVDAEYQSLGIGRKLTKWACGIADQSDAAIYLQTTAARDYYCNKLDLGFKQQKSYDDHEAGGTCIRPRKSKR
jgi:ribosomal protein S18 acetylase RimI-like enzyme